MPLITIGIPVYRRYEYFQKALESAFSQHYKDIEVIISQNYYEGTSAKRIEEYATSVSAQRPNVRYIKHQTNKGLAGNWNELVKNAKGEYIIIIGDDDIMPEYALSDLVKYVVYRPAIIFGNQMFIDKDGVAISSDSNVRYGRHEIIPGYVPNVEKYIWMNSLPITGSIIRTDLLRQLLFKEDLNTPEQELFLRLNKIDSAFYFTDAVVTHYRINNESETSGGLKYHNLLYHLILTDCSDINLEYKNACITKRIVPAFLSSLHFNDIEKFNFLMKNIYLPTRKSEKILRIILKYSYLISRSPKIAYIIGRNYYYLGRQLRTFIKKN